MMINDDENCFLVNGGLGWQEKNIYKKKIQSTPSGKEESLWTLVYSQPSPYPAFLLEDRWLFLSKVA